MKTLTLLAGHGKSGEPDQLETLNMCCGELYTIVGHTGSGKSRLIKDLEQLVDGDSVTGRRVRLDGRPIALEERSQLAGSLIAHLAQNMRFVLDITVEEFLRTHGQCRGKQVDLASILAVANDITPEGIMPEQSLNALSGGQSRALMIADIACICDSPIVLIDEIENGGIDKIKGLRALTSRDKLVLIVTHDPHIALMADKRLVLKGGAITAILEKTEAEQKLHDQLEASYIAQTEIQQLLRQGVNW